MFTDQSSLEKAIKSPDKDLWKIAGEDEIKFLQESNTWELCDLPESKKKGRKPIASKWVFELKKNDHEKVVRHEARLVAKRYTQKHGIDYDEYLHQLQGLLL